MANKRSERWYAQQRKETRYVGGRPCVKCGGLLKYTASAGCVPCTHVKNAATRKRLYHATPKTERQRRNRAYWQSLPVETRRLWARASYVRRAYGLEAADVQRLLDRQGNACAICARTFGKELRAAIDHCHSTKRVRGILCDRCNHALGHLRDDPHAARKAADYLEAYGK